MYAVVIYAPLYLKATVGAGAILNGIVLASRAVGAAGISAFGWWLSQGWVYPSNSSGLRTDGFDVGNNPATTPTQLDSAERSAFGVGFGIVLPTSTALWQN